MRIPIQPQASAATIGQPDSLPAIEAALAQSGLFQPMPEALLPRYHAAQYASHCRHVRLSVGLLLVIFDLFCLVQRSSAPELVTLSSWLRLAVLTPLGLAYIGLDSAGRLGRLQQPALLVLSATCALISAVLCVRTTSLTSLSDIRATPLVLLTTGLVLRLTPAATAVNAVVCALPFIGGIALSAVVPRAEIPSLIVTEIGYGALTWGFSTMLSKRDRMLFLLREADQIRREELAVQNAGLRAENQTDSLTGCANRRCFDSSLAEAWAACLRAGEPLGLIMFDIDHFKRFNDHYGHQGGDDCLARLAAAAARQVRAGDVIARYGGEEFAVLMPGATPPVTAAAAERIRAAVAALAMPHEGVAPGAVVSISLGVASQVPRDAQGANRLVERADQNLYEAKRHGRNRVHA